MASETALFNQIADDLVLLYHQPFGGKAKGRYRIALKLMRKLARRKRLYADDIQQISRAMVERGYILIDMESFFIVMSANSFVNYRRVNEEKIS